MSHQETDDGQVDFIPDRELPQKDSAEPEVNCKNCIHREVCYFLTALDQNKKAFECSGVCRLPFDINILATTCNKFDNGKTLAEKLTEDDTADEELPIED